MLNYNILNKKTLTKIDGVNGGEEIWDLLHMSYNLPRDFNYRLIQVTREYIARPDLLSQHIYDTPNYADVICKLNGISNPFEFNEGMYIIVPDVNDIMDFYDTNNLTGTMFDEDGVIGSKKDIRNIQKRKNEPRRANEQIIGDSNFRIDKNNKIVIY